jgi:hypothetical protein
MRILSLRPARETLSQKTSPPTPAQSIAINNVFRFIPCFFSLSFVVPVCVFLSVLGKRSFTRA